MVRKFSQGQAVVLALLLTAVVLTVGLAVVSQSIVDVRSSTQAQEVVQAFSAAEAGIEQALLAGSAGDITGYVGNASFFVRTDSLGLNKTKFILPRGMVSGDSQTLWLVSHNAGGVLGCPCGYFQGSPEITLYWGAVGASPAPALLVDVYYKLPAGGSDYSGIRMKRYAFDDPNLARSNNFDTSINTNPGPLVIDGTSTDFLYSKTVTLPSPVTFNASDGLQMIRVKILYTTGSPQPVAFDLPNLVNGTGSNQNPGLPAQGFMPSSQGSVGQPNSPSSATIQLTSVYPFPDASGIFDYAIFGGAGSIIK